MQLGLIRIVKSVLGKNKARLKWLNTRQHQDIEKYKTRSKIAIVVCKQKINQCPDNKMEHNQPKPTIHRIFTKKQGTKERKQA